MAKTTADTSGAKLVPADCISVLLMATGNTTITKAQYEMMSALDGTRTASSFEHQFRTITARAKDLKARVEAGEAFQPVQPGKSRSGTTGTASPATPKKRKAANADDDTPSKKKATPKGRGKKSSPSAQEDTTGGISDGLDDGLPQDMDEYIKTEQDWAGSYA